MEINNISKSSNEKQIDEIMKKIDKELSKPENKIDMQLVENYFKQIEELDGGRCKKTDAELAKGLNKIKKRGERVEEIIEPIKPANIHPAKKAVTIRKRLAISFAAVFLMIAFSFSVAAISLGGFNYAWFYISNSVKELFGMSSGEKDIGGITIIKGEYRKEYDTIEDLIQNEQFDDILYPSSLPDNIKIKSITQIQLDDEQYLITFQFNSKDLRYRINNYYKNDLTLLSEYTLYQTDEMNFYIAQKESEYYSIAQFDGKEYSVDYNNYEDLIYILSNMKGYKK